jgi:predicted ester cyclase
MSAAVIRQLNTNPGGGIAMTTTEHNKAVARRVFEEVVNRGRLELIEELYTDDVIDHDPLPGAPEGAEGIHYSIGGVRSAMPDVTVTVEDISAHADTVVVHNTWRGTQRGLIGFAGRNREMCSTGIVIFTFKNGQIVERWAMTDLSKKMRRPARARQAV